MLQHMKYRPFHKNLPRSTAFVYWISVRFYETDCSISDFMLFCVHWKKYEIMKRALPESAHKQG